MAKAVARRLKFTYVDTGAMYRAVALKCLRDSIDIHSAESVARVARGLDIRLEQSEDGLLEVFLNGENVTNEIRSQAVGGSVSAVAAVPAVREALVTMQRAMAKRGGVVMDGRDIGTVVLPDADVKVFLTASLLERARRRHQELKANGVDTSLDQVMAQINERDALDSSRELSPLRQADDAILIDTTGKSVDQVVAEILALCEQRLERGGRSVRKAGAGISSKEEGGAGCSTI